jgi:hypothetical protein
MHDAAKKTSVGEERLARSKAMRRAERFDMVVAFTLLLLLVFGWAVRLAPLDQWPRGDFLIAANARHV